MENQNLPDISVIIPVKNEIVGIAACIDGILAQTVPVKEIVVIDSGSTDGTQDVVKSKPKTRLLQIKPEEFNHGETRNLGVRETTGELILCTVGDAQPVNDRWIESLLAGFEADDVVGVCGSQVVAQANNTNPLEWFRPVSEPIISVKRFASAEAFTSASPKEKKAACSWDNVTAIYRREALERTPFRRVVYGEDMFFAIDTYNAGFALGFNPAARVYHFHLEDFQTILKKTVAVCLLRFKLFYWLPDAQHSSTFRKAVRLIREDRLDWREKWRWFKYNMEQDRAIRTGVSLVREAALSGGKPLEVLYEKYSETPPIPLKVTVESNQ